MPGYRMRLPEKVHPISAGVKGGLLGGLVMPIPALVYGFVERARHLVSGQSAGRHCMPGVGRMGARSSGQFHLPLFVVGILVHVTMSATLGLLYGVLLADVARHSQAAGLGRCC